jgi:predicted RNase H-like HicB family nuclease
MLLNNIKVAMRHAHYELLKDKKQYYGEIPYCKGVYATARSLEDCRDKLTEVLEEWILFRLHRRLTIPSIDHVTLKVREVA